MNTQEAQLAVVLRLKEELKRERAVKKALVGALKTYVHWSQNLAQYAGTEWADDIGLSQDCHWLNESRKEALAAIALAEGRKPVAEVERVP